MIRTLISLYSLLVLAYAVISWIRVPDNSLTDLLRRVVEPAVEFTRRMLESFLPRLTQGRFDWSPLVLFAALKVIGFLLGLFRGTLTWLL